MLRVIQEIRPTWVVGENVAGFIGMALDTVLTDLENQKYETRAFLLSACGIGAPHRRYRCAIVAYNPNCNVVGEIKKIQGGENTESGRIYQPTWGESGKDES